MPRVGMNISHKAKRVSGSTSRAETLAGVVGKELTRLVAMRMAEILYGGIQIPMRGKPPTELLIYQQENAAFSIPIDHYTDWNDFFERAVGLKGIPQDRHQRLYVLV